MNKSLLVILGNQLFHPKYFLKQKVDFVYMAEDYELCTFYKHHKLKILMYLLSMREYRDELLKKEINVIYEDFHSSNFKKSYEEKLEKVCFSNHIQKIFFFEIEDKFIEKRLLKFAKQGNYDTCILESPMFLTTRNNFKEFASDKKSLLMKNFYQKQRKKFNILITSGKPVGGRWSFDEENRKKLPKKILIPNLPRQQVSKYEKDVVDGINKFFNDHPGSCNHRWMPVSRIGAEIWLNTFLEERFSNFGFYEDAISSKKNFLFHSALSPLINIGLITPHDILQKVENFFHSVPINSYEGFIRQIIGWREFIRGVYQEKSEIQEKGNFFGHKKKLKNSWYLGNTKIEPLDDAIKFVHKYGYTHHINRLMVIGNIMNLSGVQPKEINKWFMEMFVDSSDWVMTPNVFGMTAFADGGIMATKPYICGSNYIIKMSDYKKNSWCDVLDGLYWKFIDSNQNFFKKNPRLSLMVNSLNKMDSLRKKNIFNKADIFIDENTY